MHELSLAKNIVEQAVEVAQENHSAQIISIRILLGPLAGVVQDSLEFCFEEACSGSIAQNAKLIIDHDSLVVECQRCFKQNEVTPFNLLCPHCNLPDIKVVSGKEFRIIDIEVI